jgi:RNA polymerase sigma factor (sigma-70 family)
MTDPLIAQRFAARVLPCLTQAYNLARWLTRNDQDAQDIVQEAYLRAFKFFPGFRGDDPRAWLLTIVRNTFYTWYRETHARAGDAVFDEQLHGLALEQAASSPQDDPQALLLRSEDRLRVHRALQALPLEFREVVVLRELEELSYKQIAAIVGIPIGTVMSRLGRGRQALAGLLAPLKQES